jgi:hypothetical protein
LYCAISDIVADFGKITFDANSKVTDTQVTALIESESTYIDAYLASKYKMPVIELDSPQAFAMLKRICIFRVSDRIRNILEVKSGNTNTNQDVKGQSRTPKDDLNRIIDGKLRLIDCPLASVDDGLSFGVINESYKPFNLSTDQW